MVKEGNIGGSEVGMEKKMNKEGNVLGGKGKKRVKEQ